MRKIAIVGFADSRKEAPYADNSWEIWGVNDLYHYVPRVDVTFELHHLGNLGKRRNPAHIQWLQSGKAPVVMWEANPAFPSARPFPRQMILDEFGSYFTNSISWMMALAMHEMSSPTQLADGRVLRLANPDVQLGIWGVDMAAESEYGSQRPSCEHFVGMAVGMGIPTFIPGTSDLCKTVALYGIDTTAPFRIKAEGRIASLKDEAMQLQQQLAQVEAQRRQVQSRLDQTQGAIGVWKYTRAAWTMPTDIESGAEAERKDRGEAMEGSPAASTPTPALPEGIEETNGHSSAQVELIDMAAGGSIG